MVSKLRSIVDGYWQIVLISLGFIATLWILLTAIRVGVDPYHEGAIYPSGVGIAQGLTVFSDVNNQYGFMYGIIQAPFVYFFGNYLLVERIIGVLFFSLNAFLSYRIIRAKLNPKTALFCVLLLSAINPSWSYLSGSTLGGYGIWINQYGITFTLLSISILFKNIRGSTHSHWLIFISSFVSFCGAYVRLEFAVVWVLQLIFLSLGGIHKTRKVEDSAVWIGGGLSALGLGISFLVLTGSLSDAIAQLVTVWFSTPPNSGHIGMGNILTLVSSCLLFIYLVVVVTLVSRFRYWIIWAAIAVLGNLIGMRFALHYLLDFRILGKKVGPYLFTSLDGLLLNYSSCLFLIILVLMFFEIRNHNLGVNFESGFLLVTSLGLMAQLHNVNSAYIFMLNPVFLACVLVYFRQEKPSMLNSNFTKPILTTLSLFILVSLVNGLFLNSKTTYSYQAPVLKGMLSDSAIVRDEIDRKFLLLKKSTKGRNVFMDCPFGLYSVSEEGLINADKWTWNEIPEKWRLASLSKAKAGQFFLRCGGGDIHASQYAHWESLGIIKNVGNLENFRLYKVLKNTSLIAQEQLYPPS